MSHVEKNGRRTILGECPWGGEGCAGEVWGYEVSQAEVAERRTFSWSLGTDILLEVVIEFQESREDP